MKHRASRLVSLHGFEQNLFKLSVNSQIIWVLRGRITFSISSMVPTKESRSCRIGWDLWLFESVCNNPSPSLPEDARVRSVLQVLPVQETCPDIGFVQALVSPGSGPFRGGRQLRTIVRCLTGKESVTTLCYCLFGELSFQLGTRSKCTVCRQRAVVARREKKNHFAPR